jgi:hypothetical protein
MRPSLKDREFLALLRQVQAEEADRIRKATPTRGVNDGRTTKSTPKALTSQWVTWDFDGSILVGRLDIDDGRTIYVGKREVARNGRIFVHDLGSREVADLWKCTPDAPGHVLLKRSLLVEGWTINRADSLIDRRDRPKDVATPVSRSMYDRAVVPDGALTTGSTTRRPAGAETEPADEHDSDEHPPVTPATLPPPTSRRVTPAPNAALANSAATAAAEREAAKVAAARAASEQAAAEQAAAEEAAAQAAKQKAAADKVAAEAALAQQAAQQKAADAKAAQEQAAAAERAAAEHAAAEHAAAQAAEQAEQKRAAAAAQAERAAAERAAAQAAAEQAAAEQAATEREAVEQAAAKVAAEQAAAQAAERAAQEAARVAAEHEAARRAAIEAAPPPDFPPPSLPAPAAATSAADLTARAHDAISLLQAVVLVEDVAHDTVHGGSLGVFSLGLRHEVGVMLEPLVAAGFVSGPPGGPFAGATGPAGDVPLAELEWQLRRFLDGSNPGGGWVHLHRPPL